jgi:diapolycopene oxygenase
MMLMLLLLLLLLLLLMMMMMMMMMMMQGGMGAISNCLAAAAREAGAEIVTNATVKRVLYEGNKARGVEMDDGTK